MDKEFKYSVENFRGIAIVFVMLSHIGSFSTLGDTGKYIVFLFSDATTWFVFISGYLFAYLESSENFDFKKYASKKLKFVVMPYAILSIPAVSAGLYFDRHILYNLSSFEYILWSLSVGGSVVAPMWFIPMIVLFFLSSPIFFRMNNKYFLFIVTFVLLLFSVFSARPFGNQNPIFSFFHFLGFYVLGIYLYHLRFAIQKLSKNSALAISMSGLILFLTTLFLCVKEWELGAYYSFYAQIGKFNPMQLGKFFLLLSVFIFLEQFGNFHNKYLSYFAKISFGLFFIHGFYMLVFNRFGLVIAKSSASRLFLELLVVVFLSIVSVALLKKILGKSSRYVIGC